mgnify:CR=1 FL=1
MIQEGIKTVILGKPNAGKSSLLNLLAGEEKAIVTDIAGTTRDVLEENLVLKGISLRILDTAGIRKTADTVEKIGVDRALEHAKDADLILYVVDASVPLDENDAKIMEILKGRKAIVLLNKSDLTAVIEKEEMEQKTSAPVISISAREETGMEELEEQMKTAAETKETAPDGALLREYDRLQKQMEAMRGYSWRRDMGDDVPAVWICTGGSAASDRQFFPEGSRRKWRL